MELVIDVGKILSFNEYLKAGIKKGKWGDYAYLYMDPKVRKYKTKIKNYVIKHYKDAILASEILKTKGARFHIDWNYEVTNVDSIDVSNVHKIVEDSVFDAFNAVFKKAKLKHKLNDVRVKSFFAEKHELTGLVEILRCNIRIK